MIVIDTSAVVAIFRQEQDAELHALCIGNDDEPLISSATLLEVSLVLRGLKLVSPELSERWLDEFIEVGDIRIVPVMTEHVALARLAYQQFGKGTGHSAGLNFGDCFAYALAKAMAAPLLFKGSDFSQTDIAAAL